ncbi:DNA-processing protein DprA [Bifidobacterium pseudocatenulatum]|uniref:DNA-processing protein DprA n=2 Tax=Bifidobacterium pseudocatenulatum TaxID=28026 RepID=UPI001158A181|nr:DNA-processing protein DprA [Bifidobacterium pseudocatenulatum]
MNENTTADTSVNATAIDDETLSRAVLTYCLDSADAMMYALVKGIGSATHTLQLLADSGPGNHESVATAAYKTLDAALINGITRWGRTINARGMASFHGAMVSWQHRLTTLPSTDPEELKTWFTANGTQWIVAPHHPYWPSQLADLTIHTDWAAPLCLWGKGDPQALVSCSEPVGVVGSRGVSEYGRQSAHELAKQAARAGHLIVSGGALGTDAAAHWGAIQAMDEIGTPLAGRTVAVFAGGLNYIGPKSNERLFETIINHSGALISELCPGTVPEARRFLIRNRLIAALSSTFIVAQARARSGALNTAGWANELNRRVFAVPGDVTMPHNTGCNRLIQEGQASIICSLTDIDEFCHAAHRPQSADAADNDDEPSEESTDTSLSQPTNATAAILKAIRTCSAKYGHVSADGLLAILAESNPGEYSISRISMELGLMELNGLICTQHGNITITDASAT